MLPKENNPEAEKSQGKLFGKKKKINLVALIFEIVHKCFLGANDAIL